MFIIWKIEITNPNFIIFSSSIAYAISTIAHWDWPDEWRNLFGFLMEALKSGNEAAVHGSMRVLTEFTRDLPDIHIPQVAPVILPEMHRIFCDDQVFKEVSLLLLQ